MSVAAILTAFLYLHIMVSMWLSGPTDGAPVPISKSAGLAITLAVATTPFIGVLPGLLLEISEKKYLRVFLNQDTDQIFKIIRQIDIH